MSHPEHIITAGKPVIGDQLIGRQKEIGLINHYLDSGQSVVLIAPRRYGKTSLLLEILRQRKSAGNYTASVDFFAIASILALAAEITAQVLSNKKWTWSVYQLRTQLFELLKNLQFRQTVDQYDFILGFGNAQPDEWQLLSESLKLIDNFAGENNRNIVCGFDEFGDLEKLDGDKIVKLFRSIIQLQKNSAYLFAGSYESVMTRIFSSRSSPFLRFARIIHLGPVDKDAFRIFINGVFGHNQVQHGESLTDEILTYTGGHPYYTQLLAQQAIFIQSTNKSKPIPFERVLDEVLSLENDYLEKMWEAISANRQQKTVLLAIAEGTEALYSHLDRNRINVSRTLKQLSGSGLVITKPTPTLTDPLFRTWLRKRVLKM